MSSCLCLVSIVILSALNGSSGVPLIITEDLLDAPQHVVSWKLGAADHLGEVFPLDDGAQAAPAWHRINDYMKEQLKYRGRTKKRTAPRVIHRCTNQ